MSLLVLWLIMGGVVAVIANSKGFDTFGWLIYGALIWPIALAHVIVKPSVVSSTPQPAGENDPESRRGEPGKKCPDCAETIKDDAKVCRFCGNRTFPDCASSELSAQDAWFDGLERTPPPPPKPTTWQKLWWNPHAPDRRR